MGDQLDSQVTFTHFVKTYKNQVQRIHRAKSQDYCSGGCTNRQLESGLATYHYCSMRVHGAQQAYASGLDSQLESLKCST